MATKNSKAKNKKKKADPAVTEASMALVNSQIKEGKFSQIYILTGDERFLIQTYMHRLVNAICPDALKAGANNMNFSRYQGDNVDVQAIASDIQTLPFLSPQRLTLVEGSGLLGGANEILEKALKSMPEENVVIFVESSVLKTTKLYKTIMEKGSFLEFTKPKEADIQNFIVRSLYSSVNGTTGEKITFQIENGVPELFRSLVGNDLATLQTEAEKVKSYCFEKKTITKEDISQLITKPLEDQIFKMCDAIGTGDGKTVARLYHDLLMMHRTAEDIFPIVERHYMILMQVSAGLAAHMTSSEIARNVGINPYFLSNYVDQSRLYTNKELVQIADECMAYEYKYKNGMTTAQYALEQLIMKLLEKKRQVNY